LAELISFILAKKGYVFSYFFWLDCAAVIIMITDIQTIWNPIYDGLVTTDGSGDSDAGGLEVAKASKSAKAGAKAGRVFRVIRIIRLLRVVKLYKYFQKKKDDKDGVKEPEIFSDELSGSQIGKKLNEAITKICISIVLFMLCMFPALENIKLTETSDNSPFFKFSQVRAAYNATASSGLYLGMGSTAQFAYYNQSYIQFQQTFKETLLMIQTPSELGFVDQVEIDALRQRSEISKLVLDRGFEAWLSTKAVSVNVAGLNMLQTLLVIFLLAGGALFFSKDTNSLVVVPIERMVKFVQQLAANPLGKIKPIRAKNDPQQEGFETRMLENTLMKLGGLLQVSFGTAGSEIMAKNLEAGDLDVMIPGQKIFAVFGFCDIQHFNDITGVLQTEVMVFVNQVAEIVHERTHHFSGAANKNTGNAFLCVWKFPKLRESSIIDTTKNPALEEKGGNADTTDLNMGDDAESKELARHVANPRIRSAVQNLAGQALTAFLHTIVQVAVQKDLDTWRQHPKLLAYDPNYKINMGFGLHIGWSIEGAIGSPYKVDASYLSPNVNMAARLEAATKQFGVKILFSGVFFSLLPASIQKLCRLLDRVTVKGSLVPIDCYTFDMPALGSEVLAKIGIHEEVKAVDLAGLVADDEDPLTFREGESAGQRKSGFLQKVKDNLPRSSAKVVPENPSTSPRASQKKTNLGAIQEFSNEYLANGLATLQEGIPKDFVATFSEASNAYVKGDWPLAKSIINDKVLKMMPDDKPSQVLLRVMGKTDFCAPKNWMGFRALTSK